MPKAIRDMPATLKGTDTPNKSMTEEDTYKKIPRAIKELLVGVCAFLIIAVTFNAIAAQLEPKSGAAKISATISATSYTVFAVFAIALILTTILWRRENKNNGEHIQQNENEPNTIRTLFIGYLVTTVIACVLAAGGNAQYDGSNEGRILLVISTLTYSISSCLLIIAFFIWFFRKICGRRKNTLNNNRYNSDATYHPVRAHEQDAESPGSTSMHDSGSFGATKGSSSQVFESLQMAKNVLRNTDPGRFLRGVAMEYDTTK
jgi:hypothetical protein